MHELDCIECLAHDRYRAAIPTVTQRGTDLAGFDVLRDTLARLALDGLDPFPSRREVRIAKQRAAGSAEADRARALLAAMPMDPDAEWHQTLLQTAIQ